MKTKINLFTYNCAGCGKCVRVCPNHVLKLVNNGMSRFVNVTNAEACIGCKKCEDVCSHHAIKIV